MKGNKEKIVLYAPVYLGDFIWFTSALDLIYSYDKNIKVSLIIFEEHKKLISTDKFNIDKIITINKKFFLHKNKFIRYIYKLFWLIDIPKIIKFYNYNLIFFTIPPKIFIKIFSKVYMFKNIISLDSVFQGSKIEKKDYKYFSKIIDTTKFKDSHFIIRFQTLIRSLFPTYNMAIPTLPYTKYLGNEIKSLIGETKQYKVALCTRGSADWKFLNIDFLKEVISQIDDIYDATFFVIGSGDFKFDDTDKLKKLLPNKDIRSVYNKTSLLELTEFMKNMDLLISIDTGVVHIAAAVNTPVISLCGPTLPTHSAPVYHKGVSLYSGRSCSPCDIQINTNNKICNDMKCLRDITADIVLKNVKELLNERI
jgi:ADP-heptose:LPS heptosyltransferase